MSQPNVHVRPTGLEAEARHAEALSALSHLTRLRVFFLLARAGGEMTAGAIADELDVHPATLSRHLDVLHRAGLVTRRRQERFVHYGIRPDMVSDLVRLLSACC